jgi:catechol 2,3-dioxygenase-like lactoylglutathione lyase family enzyme
VELSQIRLIVSDFPSMFRFYRDVVGLTPQFDDDAGPYGAFKLAGGGTLALQTRAEVAKVVADLAPAGGDRSLVVLKVDDVSAVPFETTEPVVLNDRIRAAYLRDPEGNLVELQQWLVSWPAAPRSAR